jgi:hypothetical protein
MFVKIKYILINTIKKVIYIFIILLLFYNNGLEKGLNFDFKLRNSLNYEQK